MNLGICIHAWNHHHSQGNISMYHIYICILTHLFLVTVSGEEDSKIQVLMFLKPMLKKKKNQHQMKVFKEKSRVCLLFRKENSYWSLKVPPEINRCSESKSEVAQSGPTLCDPMDCSLSGSFIHGIFQARVLEWIAISFSRGFSQPRNRTEVARIAGRRFTVWATRVAWVFWRTIVKIP